MDKMPDKETQAHNIRNSEDQQLLELMLACPPQSNDQLALSAEVTIRSASRLAKAMYDWKSSIARKQVMALLAESFG
jgi:hypothetical protein